MYNYLKSLTGLIGLSKHAEAEVMSFLRNTGKCDLELTSLAEVMEQRPGAIVWMHDHWQAVDRELTNLKNKGA